MQLIADVRELHKLELLQLTQQLLKVHHNVLLEMQKRQAAGSYIAAYNRAAESLDERAVDCRSSVSQVKRMAWLNPVRLTGPFDVVVYVFSCSTLYWRSPSVRRPQRLVRLTGPFDEGRRGRVFVFYVALTLTECSLTTAPITSDWSFRRRRRRVFVFYDAVLMLTECLPTTASSTSEWSFRRRSSSVCFLVLRWRTKDNSDWLTSTPGFSKVFTRDRFLKIWSLLHCVDENDPNVDKTDKI